MKYIFCFVFITLSFWASCQKIYHIGKMEWTITKPGGYKTRIDNFSYSIDKGTKFINNNFQAGKQSGDDTVLFAIGKNDSVDINIMLASYKSNSNILKYSLRGYIYLMSDFFKASYEKLGRQVELNIDSANISGIKFYLLKNKIHVNANYTYFTCMYISEISKREFSVSITYDNDIDRKAFQDAMLNSKFRNL
jgi:hypothetical protein